MDEIKPFWQSRGVWGAGVAIVCSVGVIWGYHVTPADQAQAVDLILGLIGIVSSGIALWGRVRATHTLTIGGAK